MNSHLAIIGLLAFGSEAEPITMDFSAVIDEAHCVGLVASLPGPVACPVGWLGSEASGLFAFDPDLLSGPPTYLVLRELHFPPLGIDLHQMTIGPGDSLFGGYLPGGGWSISGERLFIDDEDPAMPECRFGCRLSGPVTFVPEPMTLLLVVAGLALIWVKKSR